jgi:signal transduction histidine kinase
MPPHERDVRLLQFQAELVDQLQGVRRSDKAFKTALRRVRELFEADRACIAVVVLADSGRGISAQDLDRVSEPFFTTKRQGHGLGLSICRSIVWSMGGSMRIDSSLGEGTTVTLTLPVSTESGT